MLDGKIEEMRAAFGEIGDMRLQVMAAITIADELGEARRRIQALQDEVDSLRVLLRGRRTLAARRDADGGRDRAGRRAPRAASRILNPTAA